MGAFDDLNIPQHFEGIAEHMNLRSLGNVAEDTDGMLLDLKPKLVRKHQRFKVEGEAVDHAFAEDRVSRGS